MFDEYVLQSQLPLSDTESLCYGMDINTEFDDLEPKWAIAMFIGMELDYKYGLTFEGENQTKTINIPLSDKQASEFVVENYYKIDMNNICRYFFLMADSSMPSPIAQSFVQPTEIECK